MFQKQIFLNPFRQKNNIRLHLDCNDKCLIYLLSYMICELQYVGSTTDRFRLRWNNYKDNDRKAQRDEEHTQPELYEHFHSEKHNGLIQDCSITLTDKTDGSFLQDGKSIGVWCLKQWLLMG